MATLFLNLVSGSAIVCKAEYLPGEINFSYQMKANKIWVIVLPFSKWARSGGDVEKGVTAKEDHLKAGEIYLEYKKRIHRDSSFEKTPES